MTINIPPEVWALVVGLLMPVAISFLKDCTWPDKAKFALSLGLCLAVGAVNALVAGQLSLSIDGAEPALLAGTIVFTSAQAVYKLWFSATAANKRLEDLKIL